MADYNFRTIINHELMTITPLNTWGFYSTDRFKNTATEIKDKISGNKFKDFGLMRSSGALHAGFTLYRMNVSGCLVVEGLFDAH